MHKDLYLWSLLTLMNSLTLFSSEAWTLAISNLATRSNSLLSDLFFDFDLEGLELETGLP